jgi:hypothetical protein
MGKEFKAGATIAAVRRQTVGGQGGEIRRPVEAVAGATEVM